MNKIIIDSKDINVGKLNKSITTDYNHTEGFFTINKLDITISQDTNLVIENKSTEENSLIINIEVQNDSNLNLDIYNHGNSKKVEYRYNLKKSCTAQVNHFNSVNKIKEQIIINLLEDSSEMNYNFKTIATNEEKYSFIVNHKVSNTKSNIKTNAISIEDGSLLIKIDATINKKLKNCICNQNNHIINLNNSKCEIRPNLYIDSYDIEANHSALIGQLDKEEIFYLMSRGIDNNSATNLLIKGFLLSNTDEYMEKIITKKINMYWR